MRRTLVVAAAAAAALFLGLAPALAQTPEAEPGYVQNIVAFVKEHQAWAIPIIFTLAFGESIAFVSLILPFWGILVTLGAVLMNSGVDIIPILCASAAGAAMGDWLSYWLGYHYHRQITGMWPFTRHPDLLPKGHQFFEKWGAPAIWIARFSGPLRASVPIVAGAVKMGWLKFQFANWASAFLWAYVLLKFGGAIGSMFDPAARDELLQRITDLIHRLF